MSLIQRYSCLKIMMLMAIVYVTGLSGCLWSASNVWRLSKTDVPANVKKLATANPEHFNNPYTLLILVDSRPCTKLLTEIIWWQDWQDMMQSRGGGFVFATSRADSADLVYTAALDSVQAPVLVFPSCEHYLDEGDVLRGAEPLKLLLDSTANILHAWYARLDTAEAGLMLEQIDSLMSAP